MTSKPRRRLSTVLHSLHCALTPPNYPCSSRAAAEEMSGSSSSSGGGGSSSSSSSSITAGQRCSPPAGDAAAAADTEEGLDGCGAGGCLPLQLVHVGGTSPSARGLDWVRLFHAGLMTTNFIGDELEPVEEWEGMLSADASERAGLGALGDRESACGFAADVPYEIEFHLFMLAEVAAEHVGEVDADGLPDPAGARVVAGACTE
eukprot:COSAG01_NODE_19203_length_1024_cov_1.943784_1_plen_203_part_10